MMLQVSKLLEHGRSSAVAASLAAGDGVGLTERTTVVDVAPMQVLSPTLAEIALQAHSRIKPLENSSGLWAPLEASTADPT
jgi:hypothetical protein